MEHRMLFAVICADKPGLLETRMAVRPSHLVYLQARAETLVLVGPLLDGEQRPCGSLFVVDVADRAEAEAFAANDPYTKSGLFESTIIRGYRSVFRDGAAV